jgi:hypothetical protein
LTRLTQRHAAALANLQETEVRVQEAPGDDARTLAEWIAAGEKGERPTPVLYERERERERDAARLLVDAIALELDNALKQRLRYVEKNRDRLLADANRDVDDARTRLVAHVRSLPALRGELMAARETLVWAAAFPERAEAFGFPTALSLGLREPVERTLQTKARIEFAHVVAALEEDASALAEAHHEATKQKLGTAEPRTPLKEAMWASDPAYVEFQKQERERARRLAEWGDPNKLAAEVRESRS